jgi:hypothetical protein
MTTTPKPARKMPGRATTPRQADKAAQFAVELIEPAPEPAPEAAPVIAELIA